MRVIWAITYCAGVGLASFASAELFNHRVAARYAISGMRMEPVIWMRVLCTRRGSVQPRMQPDDTPQLTAKEETVRR